jgi:hypothetical protein
MAVHLYLIAFSVITTHAVQYFQLLNKFDKFLINFKKINRTLFSKKISDHWKEKIIFTYSYLLLFSSLQILGIFSAFVALFLVLDTINPLFGSYIFSIAGAVEAVIASLVFVSLKKMIHA